MASEGARLLGDSSGGGARRSDNDGGAFRRQTRSLRSSLTGSAKAEDSAQGGSAFAPLSNKSGSLALRSSIQSSAASAPGAGLSSHQVAGFAGSPAQSGSISFGESAPSGPGPQQSSSRTTPTAPPPPRPTVSPKRSSSMVARAAADAERVLTARSASQRDLSTGGSQKKLALGQLPRVAMLATKKADGQDRSRGAGPAERPSASQAVSGRSPARSPEHPRPQTARPASRAGPIASHAVPAEVTPRDGAGPGASGRGAERPRSAAPAWGTGRGNAFSDRPTSPVQTARAARAGWTPDRVRQVKERGAKGAPGGEGESPSPASRRGRSQGQAPRLSTELRARNPSFVRRTLDADAEAGLLPPPKSQYESMSELSRQQAEARYRADLASLKTRVLPEGTSRIDYLAQLGAELLRERDERDRNLDLIRYAELVQKDPVVAQGVRMNATSKAILRAKMQDGHQRPQEYYESQKAWLESIRLRSRRQEADMRAERERQELQECTFRPSINPPTAVARVLGNGRPRALSAPRQRPGHYRSPTASSRSKSRPRSTDRGSSRTESPAGTMSPGRERPVWANPSTNVPARWEGGGGGGAAGGARGGAAGPEGRRGVERGTGNGAARGQQTGLEARFNDVMARTPAVDSTMLSMRTVSSDREDESLGSQDGDVASDIAKFFKPLAVEGIVGGPKADGLAAFRLRDDASLLTSAPNTPAISVHDLRLSRDSALAHVGPPSPVPGPRAGQGVAPSPGSIPSTADMSGMGTGTGTGTVTGTSEAAQVAVARRISSNQRHIERLKLARSHQAEKEAALKKYDGSTWRPDVTVPVAPLEARHAERARKALARELRALRAPVSAHTPFAKSIRESASLRLD